MDATELVLGIGCRRDTPRDVLALGIASILDAHGIASARVRCLATSDKKRDERGLLALAEERGWPITFYSAEQLGEGVAERAALLRANHAQLLVPKQKYAGTMTLAIAELR